MVPDAIVIRPAEAADADAIAALHAASWRASYRGSFSDAYLDGPIGGERRAFWRARFGQPPEGLVTLIASDGGTGPAGFVCGLCDHDAVRGTLIDNLHVAPALKGNGLGRRLMQAVGNSLAARGSVGPVHLFVLVANRQAAGFYARLGGESVERMVKTEADGTVLAVERIAWRSLADFRDGAGGRRSA